MPLKLTIISYQRLSPGQETTKILDRGSVSIGRAGQCDWILQDPERILSGKHCTVHHQDGGYFLTDNSTNGVYLNDSEQRIGRNEMVRLENGDRFVLGEYEIAVTLLATSSQLDEIVQDGPVTDVARVPRIPHLPVATLPVAGIVNLGKSSSDFSKPSFANLLSEDAENAGGSLDIPPSSGLPAADAIATEPPSDLMAPDRAFFEPPELITGISPAPPEPAPTAPSPVASAAPQPDHTAEPISLAQPEPEPALDPFSGAAETGHFPAETTGAESEPAIPEDWWMAPITAAPLGPTVAPSVDKALPPAPPHPAVAKAPSALPVAQPAKAVVATAPGPAVEQSFKALPPAPPPPAVAKAPSALPVAQPVKADVATAPVGMDAKTLIHAFLEGAGLPHARLSDDQLPEIMNNLGAIFRETTQGLIEILLARSDVKGEFRLDRTNIGPIENNPLKTPPGQPPLSPEEVMTLLLIRRKDAYMSPVQAVHEGFNDIKAHQLSVMAGIQSALNRLLERFDPSNLETRLQQTVFDSILPVNRKAKYWDLFTAEYRSIAHEAEEDFNELFGREFARAYQERLRTRQDS